MNKQTSVRPRQPRDGRATPLMDPIPAGEQPAEVWIRATPASRGRGISNWQLALGGALVFLFAAVVALVAMGAFFFYASDLILPGVRVMDVSLGGQTRSEAVATLQQRWPEEALALTGGAVALPAQAAELGLTLDAEATVRDAYAQGRSMDSVLRLLVEGPALAPVYAFDPQAAREALVRLAPQVAIAPVNAGVAITAGQVQETAARDGAALDVEATLAYLQGNLPLVLQEGRLPLAMQPVAPVVTEVGDLASRTRRLLETAVTLRGYDPVADETAEWVITPDVWQRWLDLTVDATQANPFQWNADEAAAEQFLATQLPSLGEGRYLDSGSVIPALAEAIANQETSVEARIFHHPRRHVVQPGETLSSIGYDYGVPYPWIQQANPQLDSLRAGDEITIPSPDDLLPLPVVSDKRIVVSIGQQRMWAYEDGQLKWEWPVSTGIDSSPTAPGTFQVQSHELNAYAGNWDLWMPHFMGIYQPVPTVDFMNGFHGFPTRNGTNLLWTGDLGRQVTYGCILLSSDNAATLYDWAEEGVIVEVQR